MELTLNLIFSLILLILIVTTCIVFTNAVEHLGFKLKLGDGAVGSIFAAVGTALPETIVPLVAILGAYFAHGDVAAGKEIGVGAILGAPFLLSTLGMFMSGAAVLFFAKMKKRTTVMDVNGNIILRDIKFFFVSYSVSIIAGFVNSIHVRYLIVLFLICYYGLYVYRTILKSSDNQGVHGELDMLWFCKVFSCKNPSMLLIILQILFSLLCLVFFAHLFVGEIKYFAHYFNLNPLILSLIIAPIATELPEKVNSVLWMGHKKDTLALGNITGAMVFQSCFPTAVGILLTPWVFCMDSIVNIALVYAATLFLLTSILIVHKRFNPYILTSCGIFYLVYIGYVVLKLTGYNF